MTTRIRESTYHGEKAMIMEFAPYKALLLPEIGGNLISFTDMEEGYSFVRSPELEDMENFKANPTSYGIPILFPPNRYEDGSFRVNNKLYQFPVNETSTRNHLHGFFYNRPWNVIDMGASSSEVYVVLEQRIDEEHEIYQYFPHKFTFTIRYSLTLAGLFKKVRIKNNGQDCMPCMLGFHTAINAPFSKNSSIEDYQFVITIGKRWQLSERMLPTGHFQVLSKNEELMKTKGISPFFAPMDHHYTAVPQQNRNYMMLMDNREKVRFIYDVGLKYKHWMVWNADANSGFFCPEPQTNVINAPNLNLSHDQTGICLLKAGELWTETSRMYMERVE